MSVRASAAVWHDALDIKGSSLLVLLALADHADDEGRCWPSIARIARMARVERRAAQYAVKKLREMGVLRVNQNMGRHGSNEYQILIPALNVEARQQVKGGGAKYAPPVHHGAPPPCTTVHPNRHRTVRDGDDANAVLDLMMEEAGLAPKRRAEMAAALIVWRGLSLDLDQIRDVIRGVVIAAPEDPQSPAYFDKAMAKAAAMAATEGQENDQGKGRKAGKRQTAAERLAGDIAALEGAESD